MFIKSRCHESPEFEDDNRHSQECPSNEGHLHINEECFLRSSIDEMLGMFGWKGFNKWANEYVEDVFFE